jgi:hypothetical protein
MQSYVVFSSQYIIHKNVRNIVYCLVRTYSLTRECSGNRSVVFHGSQNVLSFFPEGEKEKESILYNCALLTSS